MLSENDSQETSFRRLYKKWDRKRKVSVSFDMFLHQTFTFRWLKFERKVHKQSKAKENIMEVQNQPTEVAEIMEKLQEVKLEGEENVTSLPKIDDKLKRNSLSKFFRFKSVDSLQADASGKVPKSSTLLRLFSKKDKKPEKDEAGADIATPRTSSFFMRSLVTPWISRQHSQMNLQKPLDPSATAEDEADDDDGVQEIAKSSEVF